MAFGQRILIEGRKLTIKSKVFRNIRLSNELAEQLNASGALVAGSIRPEEDKAILTLKSNKTALPKILTILERLGPIKISSSQISQARKRARLKKKARKVINWTMIVTLVGSMMAIYNRKRKLHIKLAYLFLSALPVHLWLNRKRLF